MVFCLTTIRDVVRVPPERFDCELLNVLTEELDKKYSNKVIAEVGLCIATNDLKEVQDAIIYPADGGAHHRVVFRMLVFRPFVGEVAVGTISDSNANGIRVSLDFFEDVFIPHYLLPQPSEFDARSRLWIWRYEGAEDGGIFNMSEQIRFRVESIKFNRQANDRNADDPPPQPMLAENVQVHRPGPPESSSSAVGGDISGQQNTDSLKTMAEHPMSDKVMAITASCNDQGLGLVCWGWE